MLFQVPYNDWPVLGATFLYKSILYFILAIPKMYFIILTSGWPERHYWLSVNVYSQNSNRTRNAHSFFSIQFRFELKRQYHKTVGGGKNDCSQSIPSHLRFRDSMKPIWADVRTKLGNRCQIVKFASVLPDMTSVASARHSALELPQCETACC